MHQDYPIIWEDWSCQSCVTIIAVWGTVIQVYPHLTKVGSNFLEKTTYLVILMSYYNNINIMYEPLTISPVAAVSWCMW